MAELDQKAGPREAATEQNRTSSGARKPKRRLFKRSGEAVWLTPAGRDLVIHLGAEGASKELVAHRLGLGSANELEAILEGDRKAEAAYRQGLAEHEHLLVQALTSQAVGDEETRGVTQAARELLEKVHGRQPEQASNVTIVLPDSMALDDFLKRHQVIEHKEGE